MQRSRIGWGMALWLLGSLTAPAARAYQCTVCHSKRPGMVKMHKSLRGQDCFGCHSIGEKLLGKGKPATGTAQIQRRQTDPRCAECHDKAGAPP